MADGYRLVMDQGSQAGRTFPLDRDVITLGREPSSTIPIGEIQVSRQHARITRRGGQWVIEDLGSTNGTFVNGMRLSGPHPLANGDVIGISDAVTLTFLGSGIPAAMEAMQAQAQAPQPAPPPYVPEPAYAPAPYPQPAQPAYPQPAQAAPQFEQFEQPVEKKGSKKWIFMGCGCLVLLAITACLGIFVLDYLKMLPNVFYEPLRWLGLF